MAIYEGFIEEIFQEKEIGNNGFKKRDVAIRENSPNYPQVRLFSLTKEKCLILNNYAVGDQVRVEFNMNGFKKESSTGNKYYNSDDIWKIEKI